MRNLILWILLASLVGCSGGSKSESKAPPDLKIVNSDNPGEQLDLAKVPVKDKLTIVEFYSDQCGPCIKMAEALDWLSKARTDIAIRRVNIDRRGQTEIDFNSPLAQQMKINSVPSFRIFEADGKQSAEGAAAKDRVRELYGQAQMFQKAEADPGTRQIMKDYEKKE